MNGPQLTRRETAVTLHRAVERFESLGITRGYAINAVAVDHGISPSDVMALVEPHAAILKQTEVVV
jgi:hypothetical protein